MVNKNKVFMCAPSNIAILNVYQKFYKSYHEYLPIDNKYSNSEYSCLQNLNFFIIGNYDRLSNIDAIIDERLCVDQYVNPFRIQNLFLNNVINNLRKALLSFCPRIESFNKNFGNRINNIMNISINDLKAEFLDNNNIEYLNIINKLGYEIKSIVTQTFKYSECFVRRIHIISITNEDGEMIDEECELFQSFVEELLSKVENQDVEFGNMCLSDFQNFINNFMRHLKCVESYFIKNANLIFSTCNSAAKKVLCDSYRNGCLLIIDEACQSTEADTLVALALLYDHLVLVGDQHQLPPTISCLYAKEHIEMSLMERLFKSFSNLRIRMKKKYKNVTSTLLNQQYRMHPKIALYSNEYIYNNKLIHDLSVYHRKSPYDEKVMIFDVPNKERNLTNNNTQYSTSLDNIAEVNATIKIINVLQSCEGSLFPDISIICFYRKQVNLMRSEIYKQNFIGKIRIDTVDSFQGQESDIVIVSFTRSEGLAKFIDDYRRLNVAVTRAKILLVIVGKIDYLLKCSKNIKAFIECQTIKNDISVRNIDKPIVLRTKNS
jgi:hypothetical protein